MLDSQCVAGLTGSANTGIFDGLAYHDPQDLVTGDLFVVLQKKHTLSVQSYAVT